MKMKKGSAHLRRIARSILLTAAVLTLSLPATLSATTYYLVVHGRTSKDNCKAQGGNYGTSDYYYGMDSNYGLNAIPYYTDPNGAYWKTVSDGNQDPAWTYNKGYWATSSTDHIENVRHLGFGAGAVRYVGWNGDSNHMGGAWDWNPCGARAQFWAALLAFCRGQDVCHIYTHSTGSLVVASFIAHHGDAIAAEGVNIGRIQFMDSAAGGSELANYANCVRRGDCYSVQGMPEDATSWENKGTDASVNVQSARAIHDHYQSYGFRYQTVSGYGYTDYGAVTGSMLPGEDDSVLAGHSICSVNEPTSVEAACGSGNTTFRHRWICGWNWYKPKYCYEYYGRWDPYFTILHNGHDHYQGIKYWRNYGTY